MRVVFPELEKKSDIKERKGQAKFSHRPTQLIEGGGGEERRSDTGKLLSVPRSFLSNPGPIVY